MGDALEELAERAPRVQILRSEQNVQELLVEDRRHDIAEYLCALVFTHILRLN